MRSRTILALLALATGVPAASAALVGLDTVLMGNPNITLGDSFNNGVYDIPPWLTVSGSPGPEVGETLAMHDGDFISIGYPTNSQNSTLAYSLMQLTDFPAGSTASMILFGDQPGEFISLDVSPGLAVLRDGSGATLGSVPLPASTEAGLLLTVVPQGNVIASVNGISVYDQKMDFGEVTGLGIKVVPEPATLGLIGLGCVLMSVRRRFRA